MSKIKCVLSIKEFSIIEYGKKANYIAIYPSDVAEDAVNKAIIYKFESLGETDYKQIIIIPKEQYDLVLKPQMDILSKYNQSLAESEECQLGTYQQDELDGMMNVWKLEYHEGYYAAGNGIKFDDKKSDAWKEGYRDGEFALYGDDGDDDYKMILE